MRLITVMASVLMMVGCGSAPQDSKKATTTATTPVGKAEIEQIYNELSKSYIQLRKEVVKQPSGYLKYPYLIPAGFYSQLWDWDAFFMANHFISKGEPDYMKYWVLQYANAIDDNGYVSGGMTVEGQRNVFGKFAMKPFLSQGAYHYSKAVGDFKWLEEYYEKLTKVLAYRKSTQFDENYGLYFWDNAMQSGADNNPAMNYFPEDTRSFVCADVSAFQYGELLAMAQIAKELGKEADFKKFTAEAADLKANLNKYLWSKEDGIYYNVNRKTGDLYKRPSYSSFLPLMYKMAPYEAGKKMMEDYLLNDDHFKSNYGFRSLSMQDPDYNNENIIIPFSNWQGPVWPVANYIYSIGLKHYGLGDQNAWIASKLGKRLNQDIATWGTMHENYDADNGEPLAPSKSHVDKDGKFVGFISWNLCIENVLEGVLFDKWMLLEVEGMDNF